MTRIIAGTLGGRTLRTPPGSGTRPTSDRVREALFSALDARGAVAGARVLDLYAGSGALGLEAAASQGDFVLGEVGRSGAEVAAALGRAGVFVRPVGVYGLPTALRVTIGTTRQNERFLDELARVLDATSVSL